MSSISPPSFQELPKVAVSDDLYTDDVRAAFAKIISARLLGGLDTQIVHSEQWGREEILVGIPCEVVLDVTGIGLVPVAVSGEVRFRGQVLDWDAKLLGVLRPGDVVVATYRVGRV